MHLESLCLPRSFYEQDTLSVARALLGKLIVRRLPEGLFAARIVETEAYHGPEDRASHAFRGLTRRTAPMFGPAGFSYVYQIYGMWFCLNAVTGPEGFPAAVLLRAASPLTETEKRALSGPGKLCRAMAIDKRLNQIDLTTPKDLWLADDGHHTPPESIAAAARIGVDYAGEWAQKPWRFFLKNHPDVSR